MLFNSYIFILFFLPVTWVLYFGLNRLGREGMAKWALIGMSLWFYAYFHISYLFLLAGSVLFNFLYAKVLRGRQGALWGKLLLAAGIAANLGIIFYFKYFYFCLENVSALFHLNIYANKILMPLGISFFTFQQISWLVDSYRGETAGCGLTDYTLFVVFFPQLIAGPIVLHDEMIPQFQDSSKKMPDWDKLAAGIHLFALGLFKKVMIADVLGKGADWGFAQPAALAALEVAVVSLLYTLQLYFDFSGYCDMACGIANMFGFDLPSNFRSPYRSISIYDFWQRWHMTLTRFLRKYLYFPLGGGRRGELRAAVNIMVVFLISGIWHGAGWTYILWGLIHGLASVLHRRIRHIWDRLPKILCRMLTFLFLDLTWVLFRADSLKNALVLLGKLFTPWKLQMSGDLLERFHLLEFTYIEEHIKALQAFAGKVPAIHLVICLTTALCLALFSGNSQQKKFAPNFSNAMGTIILLVWSVMSLSGLSTFLYFNF